MSEEKNNKNSEEENVKDFGSMRIRGRHGYINCISIIGQVEGHIELPSENKTTKYEHIIPMLMSIEEDVNIEGLIVLLNTMGGDVEAGLAIAELISGMSKPTVSLVLGGGHSIGVPLAVSADYSFIAPSATMTLHPIRLNGTVISTVQTFEYLIKMQERVINFITSHSGISKDDLTHLMMSTSELANDTGTIMYGDDAVKYGLINAVGTVSQALDKLKELIDEKQTN